MPGSLAFRVVTKCQVICNALRCRHVALIPRVGSCWQAVIVVDVQRCPAKRLGRQRSLRRQDVGTVGIRLVATDATMPVAKIDSEDRQQLTCPHVVDLQGAVALQGVLIVQDPSFIDRRLHGWSPLAAASDIIRCPDWSRSEPARFQKWDALS
jgi:hypothetical protein